MNSLIYLNYVIQKTDNTRISFKSDLLVILSPLKFYTKQSTKNYGITANQFNSEFVKRCFQTTLEYINMIEEMSYAEVDVECIEKGRKITDFIIKNEQDKSHQNWHDAFTKENVEAFLSLLKINSIKLSFVSLENLISQVRLFTQTAKVIRVSSGAFLPIMPDFLYILQDGVVVQQRQGQPYGVSRKHSTTLRKRNSCLNLNQLRSSFGSNQKMLPFLKLESNSQCLPKIFQASSMETPFVSCKSQSTFIQFTQHSKYKLQCSIAIYEKNSLIDYFSKTLSVEDRRGLTKMASKSTRIKIDEHKRLQILPNMVYFIYDGEVLVKMNEYQVIINKGSVIYIKDSLHNIEAKNYGECLLVLSFRCQNLKEMFPEENSEVMVAIKKKVEAAGLARQFLSKSKNIQSEVPSEQPVQFSFNTHILNFRNYHRKIQPNEPAPNRKNSSGRSGHKSTRIRIQQPHPNILEDSCRVFLSSFPYQKIVQSQSVIKTKLKSHEPNQPLFGKSAKVLTSEQKKKAQIERKRKFYADKVIRLKIKNIAEKMIPNGHKKKFKVQQAEKQILSNSFFANVIEYPIDGVSHHAAKQINKQEKRRQIAKKSIANSKYRALGRQTSAKFDFVTQIPEQGNQMLIKVVQKSEPCVKTPQTFYSLRNSQKDLQKPRHSHVAHLKHLKNHIAYRHSKTLRHLNLADESDFSRKQASTVTQKDSENSTCAGVSIKNLHMPMNSVLSQTLSRIKAMC